MSRACGIPTTWRHPTPPRARLLPAPLLVGWRVASDAKTGAQLALAHPLLLPLLLLLLLPERCSILLLMPPPPLWRRGLAPYSNRDTLIGTMPQQMLGCRRGLVGRRVDSAYAKCAARVSFLPSSRPPPLLRLLLLQRRRVLLLLPPALPIR